MNQLRKNLQFHLCLRILGDHVLLFPCRKTKSSRLLGREGWAFMACYFSECREGVCATFSLGLINHLNWMGSSPGPDHFSLHRLGTSLVLSRDPSWSVSLRAIAGGHIRHGCSIKIITNNILLSCMVSILYFLFFTLPQAAAPSWLLSRPAEGAIMGCMAATITVPYVPGQEKEPGQDAP